MRRTNWLGTTSNSHPFEPAAGDYMSLMVFDLGLAMRKKEEFESARLMDFEFRLRARAARLLAEALGVDETAVARLIATVPESEIAEKLSEFAATPLNDVRARYQTCVTEARIGLIAERGDPTPHRLA